MQDSDDYLFDNFDIDESIIAAVDEEESKYNESQRLAQSAIGRVLSSPQLPPPPKRQKLDYGWRVPQQTRAAVRTESINSLDELPEISIQDNGFYDLQASRQRKSGGSRSDIPIYNGGMNAESRGGQAQLRHVPSRRVQVNVGPAGLANALGPAASELNAGPLLAQRIQPRGMLSNAGFAQAVSTNDERQADGDTTLQKELEELRAELNKLKQEQEHVKKSLKETEDARLAKEGEVSILRKGIQRTAQEHAAEVARIKAAKEAAEAMQVQLQKEMKEEMDRLRTQFTFKQHELEVAGRTSPWTVKAKRISHNPPPTPIRMPSQMQQWNAGNAGPSTVSQTVKHSRSDPFNASENESFRPRVRVSPEKPKKSTMLPGFVNAFSSSPPQLSQSQVQRRGKGKGKEREIDAEAADSWFARPLTQRRASPPPVRHSSPASSPLNSPTRMPRVVRQLPDIQIDDAPGSGEINPITSDGDVVMVDAAKEEQPGEEVEIVDVPMTDWRAEVQRLVLTHKLANTDALTMQLLMNAPMDSEVHKKTYSDLNKKLLRSLGLPAFSFEGAEQTNKTVITILVGMGRILQASTALVPLIALLHLLRAIVFSLPSFFSLVLSSSTGNADGEAPPILVVICDIIRVQLAPKQEAMSDELERLAKETFGLLEAMVWCIPEELVMKLSYIPQCPEVLSTLLAPAHPTWFLCRSTRALTLLASHHTLFRHLLSIPPEVKQPQMDNAKQGVTKIPHIEQLAPLLMDTTRQGEEASALKESILIFVATLSLAHPEAHNILLQSETLIPSIVVFLTQLTTPFFEEDEALMNSPVLMESTVLLTARTVSLLYILVFSANDSTFNLRNKMHQARGRPFHGVWYMLLVTLGRLSYADPPHEASTAVRNELDQIIDMAKDMIGLLVDGPEHELIWAAFQTDQENADEDDKMEEDDEEHEALLQHPVSN